MKKYIEISNEVVALAKTTGKHVDGSVFYDELSGKLTFRAYRRKPRIRLRDRLICALPDGGLYESVQRFKLRISVDKRIGAVRTKQLMTDETKFATNQLVMNIK